MMRYVLPSDETEILLRIKGSICAFGQSGEHIEMFVLEDEELEEMHRAFRIYLTGESILTNDWMYLASVDNRHIFVWDETYQVEEKDGNV